jgi:hypothetical protein
MTTITTMPAAALDSFVVPSLAKLAARLARPVVKKAEVRSTAGLSVADISDASLRATAKGGLKIGTGTTRLQRRYACTR